MEHFDETILQAIPDPALVTAGQLVVCCNQAARALCPELTPGAPVPSSFPVPEGSVGVAALAGKTWRCTRTPAGGGELLLLSPAPQEGISPGRLDGVVRRLREQMGELLLSIQLLSKTGGAPGQPAWEQRLSGMNRSFCRMLRLVNHLDLLRDMEDNARPVRTLTLDLAGLCREVTAAAAPLLYQTGVSLRYDYQLTSLLVRGDPELLQQLLLELIANGGRAAAPRGALTLSLARREGRAILTLTDDGSGGEERALAELLAEQWDQDRLPQPGEGAGLGLVLARRIVGLHQGALMMERRPQGLSVTVALPLAPDSAPLPVRTPRAEYGGGFSPVLVELSELLPTALYSSADLE